MNINVQVRVKLTPHGLKVLRTRYRELAWPGGAPWPADPPGLTGNVLECGLWELMSEFGPSIHMGCEQLFELNEIEVL